MMLGVFIIGAIIALSIAVIILLSICALGSIVIKVIINLIKNMKDDGSEDF